MKTKIKYLLISCVMLFSTSCEDFLDHPVTGSITDDNIGGILANNPSQIASFLKSSYRFMGGFNLYGRYLSYCDQEMAHEVDMDYISDLPWNEFSKNDITSTNTYVSTFYTSLYSIINNANLVVNFVNQMDESKLSSAVVAEIRNYKGEALFLRAYCHFLLLRYYGEKGPNFGGNYPNNKDAQGVVLMRELATAENAYVGRATVKECYEAIITDLKEAKNFIGDNQIPVNKIVRKPGASDADYTKDFGWAQKPAVNALLGTVYLYMNDYVNAKTEFESVINDSRFALDKPVNFTDYIQHNDNNAESIFSLQYYDETGRTNIYIFDPLHMVPRIHTNVQGAYKNTFFEKRNIARFGSDPRLYEATLYDYTWSTWSTSTTGPVWKTIDVNAADFRCYVRKYIDFFDYGSPRDVTKNIEIIRLADVYLMYAETVLAQGNTALATEYVNKVRRRAWNETDYNAKGTKGEDFQTVDLSVIQEERFKEFYFEGLRWFDICRWGILEKELAKYPTTLAGVVTYNPQDYYLPIPEGELSKNNYLKQSKGY